jgi:hypothetical protein
MWPREAAAIPRVSILACRDARFMDTGSGRHPTPVSCGREFSTSLPYIFLYGQVEDVDRAVTLAWQLNDPDNEVAARARFQITPPNEYYTWTHYFYAVLPVAATEKDIVDRNPAFRFRVIQVGAKPVSEIPGEWKLRVTLDGRPAGTLSFWLKP